MLSSSKVSEESDNPDSSSDDRLNNLRCLSGSVQPSGFRKLCSRINKFSGESGEEDFEVLLEDFVEATNNDQTSNVLVG